MNARPSGDPPESRIRARDRKSTRLNSSHSQISYAVFCLKKKKTRLSPVYAIQGLRVGVLSVAQVLDSSVSRYRTAGSVCHSVESHNGYHARHPYLAGYAQ